MAVRHHLNVLQAEDLIEVAHTKRERRPGRPVQVYILTDKARKFYPQEYVQLTNLLVEEITDRFGQDGLTAVFDGMANRLAAEAPLLTKNLSFEERLNTLADFLRQKGFSVEWERENGQYVIHHLDCPYRQFAQKHQIVCQMDKKVIGNILQVTPTQVSCIAHNDDRCTYIISASDIAQNPQPVKVSIPN
jgi:predicted ArsR family transcriptional regulator